MSKGNRNNIFGSVREWFAEGNQRAKICLSLREGLLFSLFLDEDHQYVKTQKRGGKSSWREMNGE